jgi:hypothetical protein
MTLTIASDNPNALFAQRTGPFRPMVLEASFGPPVRDALPPRPATTDDTRDGAQ